MELSFAYRRPVRELQQMITSREFTELQAYERRNTLAPDLWWSNAMSTSMQVAAMSGQWIDPKLMVPGQVDPEAFRKAQENAAERAMDARSQKETKWQVSESSAYR